MMTPRISSSRLSAMHLLEPPRWARFCSWILLFLLILGPFLLVWLPWQQNVSAKGRFIAFDPTERQQEIEAPISGRITQWYVQEGQEVKKGDRLVMMQDPDPLLPSRLADNRDAIRARKQAAAGRVSTYTEQIKNLEGSRDRALAAADQRLKGAKEAYKAAQRQVEIAVANRTLAKITFGMEEKLIKDGLTSELVYETARQRRLATEQEELRSRNAEEAARLAVEAIREDIEKIRNDAEASIRTAQANRQSAEAEEAQAVRDLAEIEVRIARQATQEVLSPCDGVVYRILANSSAGGSCVKEGAALLIVTPQIKEDTRRVAELYVEGNDAPQLTELWRQRLANDPNAKIKARIQFEGWPAIQWIGWPTLAVGTFGGRVVFVDPHDDGKGKFRVLVEPDPDDKPWPSPFLLRQGSRVQGWLMLNRVSLGYELWRRFNGFPPVILDDKEVKEKPAKVKVPK
jgi:multidrug efflux pump subunit AcrA (membrane-fusion protein)